MLLARELTKLFETVVVCPLHDILRWLDGDPNRERGEFVLAIEAPAKPERAARPLDLDRTLTALLADLPLKQAVQLATKITGEPRNTLYQRALELKQTTR